MTPSHRRVYACLKLHLLCRHHQTLNRTQPSLSWLAAYFRAIAKIAAREQAKLYIPVSAPTTAIYDSLTQDVLPKDCVCWTLPPQLTGKLDDKTAFTDLCNEVRLPSDQACW